MRERVGPRKRQSIAVDFYYDIEVSGWDTFVCGGVLFRDPAGGGWSWRWSRDEDRFVELVLACKGVGWAHNGGRFDTLLVLKHMLDMRGVQVFTAGQRVICVKSRGIELRDSAALIPLTLEDAAPIGGHEKGEPGLSCVCGRSGQLGSRRPGSPAGCGGYCSITRHMPARDLERVVAYMHQDCVCGRDMLLALQAFADEHDLDLGATIGSAAWKCAKRRSGLDAADWDNDRSSAATLYKFARDGYYGGRTQVFQPRAAHGFRFDITSAYPAALARLSLPTGERAERFGVGAAQSFEMGREGIYEARVYVPEDTLIPVLPVKTGARIAYPVGEIYGTWTGIELRYALERGAVMRNVSRAVVWAEARPVLKAWCDYVWSLRDMCLQRAATGGPASRTHKALAAWLKWYANSLTGKLAQRPEREHVVINPKSEWRGCPKRGLCFHKGNRPGPICGNSSVGCCPHVCIGACGRPAPIDRERRIWTKQVWRLSDCSYVEHSGYLTAGTRITLHKFLVADDEGMSAVYCDTDSTYSTRDRREQLPEMVSNEKTLGLFFYEGEFFDFESHAPKTYAFVDEWGQFIAKSKGIPDAARNYDQLGGRFGGVTIDRGVKTLRTAIRDNNSDGRGLFVRKSMWRTVNADGIHFGDRVLGTDGRTRPQVMSALTA